MAMGSKWPRMRNNIWLDNSGASCHMCNDDTNMFDWTPIDSHIKIGDGKYMSATKIGKLKLTVVQASGSKQEITIQEVQYVPTLAINLFSITKALDNGWKISNEKLLVSLTKNNARLTFDTV